LLNDNVVREMEERAEAEVADAVQFAEAAAKPPVERAFKDVY
jgi:TPP-dependent pyruvate/acetoin dehydrogenase alpha subunit